jgi:hypothetical protein
MWLVYTYDDLATIDRYASVNDGRNIGALVHKCAKRSLVAIELTQLGQRQADIEIQLRAWL